jgi:hypothetical protein
MTLTVKVQVLEGLNGVSLLASLVHDKILARLEFHLLKSIIGTNMPILSSAPLAGNK